jgi:hypothetical protein
LFTLTQPDPTVLDRFGSAIAVGDINGDGKGDIAVGAFDQDYGGHPQEGRAYVFTGVDGSLLFTLDNPTGADNSESWFGKTVAMGDVNGDDRADMHITMGGQVGDSLFQGRVYGFAAPSGSSIFTLDTPNPQNSAYFGSSLAVGDIDFDGINEIIAGANGEDVGSNENQGRVYIFDLDSVPIPTLSEWGLIIFTLLILSLVTAVVTRRKTAMAGAVATGMPTAIRETLFFPTLYLRVLTIMLGLAAITLTVATILSGTLPIRDIVGTILSSAIVAYIAHLWIYRSK